MLKFLLVQGCAICGLRRGVGGLGCAEGGCRSRHEDGAVGLSYLGLSHVLNVDVGAHDGGRHGHAEEGREWSLY